ncbi:hypothetical protein EYF80_066437 [Liparis tanakae]|uniref:Uncharacterized protein n=1 Tax=Liparis tanakae TaxID=230148 RepID=A0A4Z2E522_9TELE|nr:hypothetical protein EYF80_066437 [Liparis tanakae]
MRFIRCINVCYYSPQTSSSCWWLKKRFFLSSMSGSPVWTRCIQIPPTLKRNRRTQSPPTLKRNGRTQSPPTLKRNRRTQSPPTLKRNRRNSGPVRRENSFKGWRRLVSSSHSLL